MSLFLTKERVIEADFGVFIALLACMFGFGFFCGMIVAMVVIGSH